MNHIKDSLLKIRYQVNGASKNAALIAVSKHQPPEKVAITLQIGQRLFGENRVQEALAKWPTLKEAYPDIQLHLIGPLQTNKAKEAVALFDAIQTLDRPKLATALLKEMQAQNRRPECYIQVNTGHEPQKAGVMPEEADNFIRQCIADGLPVTGLMCIPPAGEDPVPHFTLLKTLAQRNNLPNLSMGMSGDYMQAIACGATHVRVGTAIFGERAGI